VTLTISRLPAREQVELAGHLREWRVNPVLFAKEALGLSLDTWQAQALHSVATNSRVAMSACKGPGKSFCLAITVWWFLCTRPDAQVICSSITSANLRDGLWKELALLQAKSPLLQDLFELTGERILARDSPKTWWCSARSWAADADATQQANTLAGFHGQHVMIVLDEVGDFPMGVLMAAQGIFANQDAEAKIVCAGNPTRLDGPLHYITTKDRARWVVIYITGDPDDPNRSPRVSLEEAKQLIADFGRDHDWVRVNVLGLFPRVGSDKILGPDEVLTAEQRACQLQDFESDPIIFGLDVARSKVGDRSVLYKRQGCVAWKPWVWRGLDGTQLGDQVATILREEKNYDYLVVDLGGPGASVYDRLRVLGFEESVIPIDFGSSPTDARYADRGTEAWMLMADWVRKRGCLPQGDGELGAELTTRKYGYRVRGKRTCFCLESKDQLKARGILSPDKADGLALTFAAPLGPRPRRQTGPALMEQQWSNAGRYLTEDDLQSPFRD
jgi:phage terminase large subunit